MRWACKIPILLGAAVAGGWVGSADVWAVCCPAQKILLLPSHACPTVVCFCSSEGAEGNTSKKKASERSESLPPRSGERSIRVRGDMGVHPLDRQAACQEAEQSAHQQLYEELGRWAEQLTGQKLSARRLVAEHAWLLAQPGVQQTHQMQVEEKPHGWVAWQEITFSAPTPALAQWAERLHQQKQQRTWWLGGAGAATLLAWLIGLWGMIRWDRATGGYYRAGVVLGSLLILAALTGLGWWLLWVGLY